MNIANKITVFRILMIPVFVIAFYLYKTSNMIPALIFIIAALTDFLDGYLARSRNLVTTFGKFLDPLADKILTISALVLLTGNGTIESWATIIIICRELIITGFRTLAASSGITLAASSSGKLKTVFQFIAIALFLMNNTFIFKIPFDAAQMVFYISVVLTVLSGVEYVKKNIHVLDLNNI